MKILPYIDPNGVPRERERAPYRVVLMSEGERHFIGFLPEGEGLTCLEFARIFSLALRPGTDPQEARELATQLSVHLEGLDAVYDSERDPPPSFPNIIPLRAA